jgi:uncharacterized protein (UPF0264 family)
MTGPIRLLVSVANATEARDAADGGADLIDAKDPLNGALGAVSLSVLHQIHAAVAGRHAVTAALGDADDEMTIERLACDYAATGVRFVKIGFAGINSPARVGRLIAAAVRGVRAADCGVVAVAYADTGGTTSVDRSALIEAAAGAGAAGVLLDTQHKEGLGLSGLVAPDTLATWVGTAHERGLMVALAGKLTADDFPLVADTRADIVGVRGAACASGRSGPIVACRVRALKSSLHPDSHPSLAALSAVLRSFA